MYSCGGFEICGRADDVINKDGIKIYPAAVEAVLKRHELVKEAAVCGINVSPSITKICACVVPMMNHKLTEDELKLHCSKFQSGQAKVQMAPDVYVLRDQMPLLPNGKVDKMGLLETFRSIIV